jgi:hypothetical protein
MGMDFKKLAQACVDAEESHAIKHKSGEPRTKIGVQGDQTSSDKIHILTAPHGKHLMGCPKTYVKKHDVTLIEITCRDIREFYEEMDWTVEEFIDEVAKTLH